MKWWDSLRGRRNNLRPRPSWDRYFVGLAKAAAARGDCRRSRVGAVLIDSRTKVVLGVGYNGVYPGSPGCLSGACPRGLLSYSKLPQLSDYSNCIGIHAEDNCIRNSFGLDMYRSAGWQMTMYVTRQPCPDCWHLMMSHGITRMVWPSEDGQRLLSWEDF